MPDLSSNNQKILLGIARAAIRNHLETGNDIPDPVPAESELNIPCACFVTLHKRGALRGCVGTFDPSEPLFRNVARMAVAAAFRDTRFPPVEKSELPEIKVEISLLGKLEKTSSLEEIEIGKHGIWIKLGSRGGTFLPEVATEQHWTREEFVMYCAREKAGLSPAEYARAEIYRYEVRKISE